MAYTGEETHTRNLVLFDIDGTLLDTESKQGYFPALMDEMAAAFPEKLTEAGIANGGEGLLETWYNGKAEAARQYRMAHANDRAPSLADYDAWWRQHPKNTERTAFDPINYTRVLLGVSEGESDRWLRTLTARQPRTLAQEHAFPGALELWQSAEAADDTEAALFTKGGEVLQPQKARELFGGRIMLRTTVIFEGNKGRKINESWNPETEKYEWQTAGGLIVADRVAIVEDSRAQVETLRDTTSCMAVLITQSAVELETGAHPRIVPVERVGAVAPVLRNANYLPAN